LIIDFSAETLKIFMKIYQDMIEDSFLLRKQKEKMQKVNKIRTLICWNSEIDNKDLSKQSLEIKRSYQVFALNFAE
jgi:hypothetical protein